MTEKKKLCVSSLVLGIVGTVFSFFFPVVAYSCSVTGLALGVKKRHRLSSSAGIALNITALVIAAVNSVCGILMTLKMFGSKDAEDDERSL